MARQPKTLCAFCGGKLTPGASFCGTCEQPTQWASCDERIDWELRQWQRARGAPVVGAHALHKRRAVASTPVPRRASIAIDVEMERQPAMAAASPARAPERTIPIRNTAPSIPSLPPRAPVPGGSVAARREHALRLKLESASAAVAPEVPPPAVQARAPAEPQARAPGADPEALRALQARVAELEARLARTDAMLAGGSGITWTQLWRLLSAKARAVASSAARVAER